MIKPFKSLMYILLSLSTLCTTEHILICAPGHWAYDKSFVDCFDVYVCCQTVQTDSKLPCYEMAQLRRNWLTFSCITAILVLVQETLKQEVVHLQLTVNVNLA